MKSTLIKLFCGKELKTASWNRHIGLYKGIKEENICKVCLASYNNYLKNDFENDVALACDCKDLNEVFNIKLLGYSTIHNLYENRFKKDIELCKIPYIQNDYFEQEMNSLCKKYTGLSLNEYIHSDKVNQAKYQRCCDTMEKRYGYRNYGESDAHKSNMKVINGKTKNPFCSIDFRYREYIRGKCVLPKNKEAFEKYSKEVWKLTEKNIKTVEFTGRCFYTGILIHKDNNPNSSDHASIDHRESILSCFLKGLTAEQCANPNNLCWTSKYFNSIKGYKSESEIRLSGFIERFLEVWNIIKPKNDTLEVLLKDGELILL